MITIPQLVPLVEAARPNCPSLTEKTIVISPEAITGCNTFTEMLKTNADGVDLLKGSDINSEEDSVLLPYSSGTTVIALASKCSISDGKKINFLRIELIKCM